MNRSSTFFGNFIESLLPGPFTKLYVLECTNFSNLSNHRNVHLSHPSNFEHINANAIVCLSISLISLMQGYCVVSNYQIPHVLFNLQGN
jgi:hypothetical protein